MTLAAKRARGSGLGALAGLALLAGTATGAWAQSGNVAVDLSVLDSPQPSPLGTIVLKPPPGVKPATRSGSGAIKLKAPPQAKPAAAAAPKPAPAPAAPTAAAPTPIAAAPSAPVSAPAPAPAPTPAAASEPAAPPTMSNVRVNRTQEPTAPGAASVPGDPSSTVANIEAAMDAPPKPTPAAPVTAPMANPAPTGPVGPVIGAGATPGETQTAALPNPTAETTIEIKGETTTLSFEAGASDLSADNAQSLRSLAESLAGNPSLRVQLLAYASDPEKNASRSRRLSLARALAVRTYLIDAGIDSTRIEVRALGDQNDGGGGDRVDAVTAQR